MFFSGSIRSQDQSYSWSHGQDIPLRIKEQVCLSRSGLSGGGQDPLHLSSQPLQDGVEQAE